MSEPPKHEKKPQPQSVDNEQIIEDVDSKPIAVDFKKLVEDHREAFEYLKDK
jgi:hypothetical protein